MFFLIAPPLLFRKVAIHAIVLLIFSIGCSDEPIKNEADEELLQLKEAFVVGFDQCAPYHGRIFAIVNPADTIIAYNFPDSIYTFPKEYYSNYLFDCLFPENVLSEYPIKIKFRPSEPHELSAFVCFSNIHIARLSPLVKNKQVMIVSVEE